MLLEQQQQQISALQAKINTINEQLQQSEKNLKAQEDFLNTKKKVNHFWTIQSVERFWREFHLKTTSQTQVEEFLKSKVTEKLSKLLTESNVSESELEQLCNKIAQCCTKEAIGVRTQTLPGMSNNNI